MPIFLLSILKKPVVIVSILAALIIGYLFINLTIKKAELTTCKAQVAQLNTQIQGLNAEVAGLNGQLANSQNNVTGLGNQVKQCQKSTTDYNNMKKRIDGLLKTCPGEAPPTHPQSHDEVIKPPTSIEVKDKIEEVKPSPDKPATETKLATEEDKNEIDIYNSILDLFQSK